MKKTNVIIGCLIFVFLVAISSCGARKVNKQLSKEETKTELTDNSVKEKQTETNIKTETKLKVDDKNESVTTETTYSPEDPTKEAYVIEKDGTKVVLNNSKKIVKTETKKNNTSTVKENLTVENKKETDKERKAVEKVNISTKQNKSKESESSGFDWLSLWWLYVIILGLLYFFRKNIPILKHIP